MPVLRPRPALPQGVKNYLTPDGERRLREEAQRLARTERPRFAAVPDDPDARRKLKAIDLRLAEIERSLATAVIVPAPPQPWERVRFGATVTVRDEDGHEETYRIVGADEVDADRGWVSFLSPIAKALLNAPLGGRVKFRFPSGEEELEVARIAYQ